MESYLKIVHIDFKGAPVKLDYLKEVVKFLKKYGLDGLLLEYEDMFPYDGRIAFIKKPDAYSKSELEEFLSFCQELNLVVIPLIQTYGHLEFILKHEQFRSLRENFKYPMTLCPSLDDSVNLLKEMIDQVIQFHPFSNYFHIGADEVFDFNVCETCKLKSLDKPRMFLEHVISIASYVKQHHQRQPIMWDDMLRDIDQKLILASNLSSYVELMIWNYAPLLTLEETYFSTVLSLFPRVWAASAYKGANGALQQVVSTSVYVKNNQSWISRIKASNQLSNTGKFVGIVLTGWSRYDHFATLCEILPASIPCLTLCLQIISTGTFTVDMHEQLSKNLGFPELIPWEPMIKCIDPACVLLFPGFEIYQALSGWYLLSCEMNQILGSDHFNGWMSKHHRKTLSANTATVEVLVKQIDGLVLRLINWKAIFEKSFQSALLPSAVDEWFQCNVNIKINKLQKRVREGHQLLAVGDSVFDRSRLLGDC